MNRFSLIVALILTLSLFPGCGPGGTSSRGPWITKLSALPPPVRQSLIESFRPSKNYLKEHPDFPEIKDEEIITDAPHKFNAGCVVQEGFAGNLFRRAREAAGSWVVEYEYGGDATGTDVIVLTPDKAGVLRPQPPAAIARLAPADAEATVSELLQRARTNP